MIEPSIKVTINPPAPMVVFDPPVDWPTFICPAHRRAVKNNGRCPELGCGYRVGN